MSEEIVCPYCEAGPGAGCAMCGVMKIKRRSANFVLSRTLPTRSEYDAYMREVVQFFHIEKGVGLNRLKIGFPGGKDGIKKYLEQIKGGK